MRAIFLAIFLAITGCSTQIRYSALPNTFELEEIALLPLKYPSDVTEDKVRVVSSAIRAELENSGYRVVADDVVQDGCAVGICTSIGSSNYLEVGITSFAQNSFLAGYLNAITAEVALLDSRLAPVLKIDGFESERGGVLFNSGQILQGISEQLENSSDAAFRKLAAKFATGLVSKLPPPKKSTSAAIPSPRIIDLKFDRVTANEGEVCAIASNATAGALVSQGARSRLREVTPGRFCNFFYLPALSSEVLIEVANRVGDKEIRSLSIGTAANCAAPPKVDLMDQRVTVSMTNCPVQEFIVYSNNRPVLFPKSSSFVLPYMKNAVYYLVGRASNNIFTEPLRLN